MKPASKLSKKEVIDYLVKCGIWVKDSKIARADLDRAKVALENMKEDMANIEHGQNPENVEEFAKPQDAVASSVILTKQTPMGKVELIDGNHEWRIRLPDGTLKGIATKHLSIDKVKKYFDEMPVEKMYAKSVKANLLPTIINGDKERYAIALGEYLMVAKLAIMEHLEKKGDKSLDEYIDVINHVENELKAWS
jgi:hypothetical protein